MTLLLLIGVMTFLFSLTKYNPVVRSQAFLRLNPILLPGRKKTTPLFAVRFRATPPLSDALQVVIQPRCSQSGTRGDEVVRSFLMLVSPGNLLKIVMNTSKSMFFLLHLVKYKFISLSIWMIFRNF